MIRLYVRGLNHVLRLRWFVVLGAAGLLAAVLGGVLPHLRRDFFPEVDAGAFEMYVRLNTGTRIEETEKEVAEVENLIRRVIGKDLELTISQLGVWADWSCAYTPNSGPMDAVLSVQLKTEREHSAQYYAAALRSAMAEDDRFAALEVSFNTGGTIRSAMNEGGATPIDIRIEGRNLRKSREVASRVMQEVANIDGVVDARILAAA